LFESEGVSFLFPRSPPPFFPSSDGFFPNFPFPPPSPFGWFLLILGSRTPSVKDGSPAHFFLSNCSSVLLPVNLYTGLHQISRFFRLAKLVRPGFGQDVHTLPGWMVVPQSGFWVFGLVIFFEHRRFKRFRMGREHPGFPRVPGLTSLFLWGA